MYYLKFILRSTFEDLGRSKLRTFLTSLGILIGISSVVLLSAMGLGLKKYIEDQFRDLGANLIMVMPGKGLAGGFSSGAGMMEGARFDEKDVVNLKKIKNVTIVVPAFAGYSDVEGNGKAESYEIIASTPEIFQILNMEPDVGELFDNADVEKKNKIVVLGSGPAEKVFGSASEALGKTAMIKDMGFKVTGVLKSKGGGGFGEPGMDDHVFIPYKAAYSFNPDKKFLMLYARATEEKYVGEVKNDINTVLLKRYNQDDFSVSDQKEIIDMLSTIFNSVNMVLMAISAISLVVGGVGIMNIMYVSVVERINEIGIRRAVGAMDHDILFLFLSESVILSLIGGVFGLLFSYTVVILLQPIFPAYINLASVLLAIGVSFTIGIFFGVFPARKAAKLTPIEAIVHE